MKAVMILFSYFYLWKLKFNRYSVTAWPGSFTFPCMLLRLFSFFTRVATGSVLNNRVFVKIAQNSKESTSARVAF